MHIALIDTTFTSPPLGGSHTFLMGLCGGLVRSSHQVAVVGQRGPDTSVWASLSEAGVHLTGDLWCASHLPEERSELLAKWLEAWKPDVFVITNSTDSGWLVLPRLAPSVATVSIAHNDVSGYYDPVRHYAAFLDCAVGVSAAIARRLVNDAGLPENRVEQIPYGIDLLPEQDIRAAVASSSRAGAPLRIGYIGRLVQTQKRILDLVAIAQGLAARGVPFEFNIVGDGPDRGRLQAGFADAGLLRQLRFWGWLEQDRIGCILRELDCFVLTSEYEGLPVALLEAMGHAVAPLVTQIRSGNAELVDDGRNGFLIEVGNIPGFVSRLALLSRNRDLLVRLRQGAWAAAQDYSLARMIERYVSCFTRLTDPAFDRGHRPPSGSYPVMSSCRSTYPVWMRKLKLRVQSRLLQGSAP